MRPFRLDRPTGPAVPLLYDSPHSGRDYPEDFGAAATRADLRRGEDAYVDELLAGADSRGVTVLTATYPRCYVDVNRGEGDLDGEMLAEPWPGPLSPTEKSARGLGLIRRLVVPGVAIYDRKLSVEEVRRRIEGVYRPYRAELRRLRDTLLGEHGVVWHVNWHSMKSVGNAMTPDGEGTQRPDFVIGDLRGTSAGPELMDLVVETLRGLGYRVAVNDPYAGGSIVQEMGNPAAGVHSLQIEINRSLYLDEPSVQRTAGFEALRMNLERLTAELTSVLHNS